jgi:hypothetical protein
MVSVGGAVYKSVKNRNHKTNRLKNKKIALMRLCFQIKPILILSSFVASWQLLRKFKSRSAGKI